MPLSHHWHLHELTFGTLLVACRLLRSIIESTKIHLFHYIIIWTHPGRAVLIKVNSSRVEAEKCRNHGAELESEVHATVSSHNLGSLTTQAQAS